MSLDAHSPSNEIKILLLAAGSSVRMGKSKQLLSVGGESLLQRAVTAAINTGMSSSVVLGAYEAEHQKEIAHLPIQIIHNENWRKGMGRSLKVGLTFLMTQPSAIEGIIVMVCDQPFVSDSHILKIKDAYISSQRPIVACQYFGTVGVPAFFHSSLFSELLTMDDDQGAKKIIHRHLSDTFLIDFPEGSIDLDTPEDYERFSR